MLKRFRSFQFNVDTDVFNDRTDQISPAVLCQINEHFWNEFIGTCETRWGEFDQISTAAASKLSEFMNNSNSEKEIHEHLTRRRRTDKPYEIDYAIIEKDPVLQIVDK